MNLTQYDHDPAKWSANLETIHHIPHAVAIGQIQATQDFLKDTGVW